MGWSIMDNDKLCSCFIVLMAITKERLVDKTLFTL